MHLLYIVLMSLEVILDVVEYLRIEFSAGCIGTSSTVQLHLLHTRCQYVNIIIALVLDIDMVCLLGIENA